MDHPDNCQNYTVEYVGENGRRVPAPAPLCQYSDQAARRAVKDTFAILGVDINDPKQVEEFRKSLRFSDELRSLADKSKLMIVTALVGAMMAALWVGLKTKLGAPG